MTRFRSNVLIGDEPRLTQRQQRHLVSHPHPAALDPPDGDAADEAGEVQRGDQHLERLLGIALGLGDVIEDGLEQRRQIGARLVQVARGGTGSAGGIKEGGIQLLVGGLQVDEEAQHLIVHPHRLGVGPVDLVDRHDGPKPQRQRLPGDEPGLRHRPFGRIHQDQHPVHHPEDPLDLAAEVGVARSVHDVDLGPVPHHGRILGQDGDAALPLQRVGVHHPLFHLLVGPERPRLPEHLINQSGLAVIDVRDDCQITNQSTLPAQWPEQWRPGRPGLRGAYID